MIWPPSTKVNLILLILIMTISPQNSEDGSQCGDNSYVRCSTVREEVCVATLRTNGTLLKEECLRSKKYFEICRTLSCAKGMSCLVLKSSDGHLDDQADGNGQIHVGCVYQSEELDRFASKHRSRGNASEVSDEDTVPGENDTPVAWCIVISVLSLLPLIVLACIVIYRFVYKLPRIGREKEELTRLFQTLGYDENTEIYKKVIDFFYK